MTDQFRRQFQQQSRGQSRELPERPDLRRLKDEAKQRVRAGQFPTLADAQLAVAREHGFVSWPRLKTFVDTRALDIGARAAALVRSACSSDLRTARTLLEAEPGLARHDLATACVTGEIDDVRRRIDADPAAVTRRCAPLDRPPLAYACFSRFLRAEPARVEGIVAVARLLLAAGADPDAGYRTADGEIQVPVYGAAGIANNAELTELLLQAGADPDETLAPPDPADVKASPWGNESLYHAAEFADTRCARLLLAAGPHPLRVSYCLGRALDFDNHDMVAAFLDHGADPNFVVPWNRRRAQLHKAALTGRPAATVQLLLDHGAAVDAADADGMTPLRLAVRYGHEGVADILRSNGADESLVTEQDRAHGAVLAGSPATADQPAGGPELVPDLGPPELVPDQAVLVRAAEHGDVDGVRRLVDAGAAYDGEASGLPLHAAAWRGQAEVVAFLLRRGARWDALAPWGADALGTALHGSQHCHDVDGGPTMRTVEEVAHGDYPGVVRSLLAAGATVPDGSSDEVTELLTELSTLLTRLSTRPGPAVEAGTDSGAEPGSGSAGDSGASVG